MVQTSLAYIDRFFTSQSVLFLREEDGTLCRSRLSLGDVQISEAEYAAALWCCQRNTPAGVHTAAPVGAAFHFVPLTTPDSNVGVLGIRLEDREGWAQEQEDFLLALGRNLSLSLERELLAQENRRNLMNAESERLSKVVLNTVSHERRTPLTTIAGEEQQDRELPRGQRAAHRHTVADRSSPGKGRASLSLPGARPKIGIGSIRAMASLAPVRQRSPALRAWLLAAALVLLVVPAVAHGEVYTVRKGETLYRISRKFDVPVAVLQTLNGIADPSQLKIGEQIRLPERYSVQKGDTLYGIARAQKLPLADLMRLNGIREGDTLRAGQVLYVPGKAAPQGTAAKPTPPAQPVGTKPVAVAPQNSLLWPLQGRREPLSGRITGTAIYGSAGQAVVSVSSGRVVWSGPYRGFSRVVLIEAKSGYTYVYAGNEETFVAVGDSVEPGAEIGRLGTNVHQGVPQLYFLVYRNGEPVDPASAPRS